MGTEDSASFFQTLCNLRLLQNEECLMPKRRWLIGTEDHGYFPGLAKFSEVKAGSKTSQQHVVESVSRMGSVYLAKLAGIQKPVKITKVLTN